MNISGKKMKDFIIRHNLYILLGIAVFLSLFLFMINGFYNSDYINYSSKFIGRKILPNFKKRDVKKIIITDLSGKEIIIDKVKNSWNEVNLYNYPVDENKVNSFLNALCSAEIIQTVITNNHALNKLELNFEQKHSDIQNSVAASVKLYDFKNKNIADLIIGKRRVEKIARSGEKLYLGRYVVITGENQIFFTDNQFVSTGFRDNEWLNKTFPKIRSVKTVELLVSNNLKWKIERRKLGGTFFMDGDVNNKIMNETVSKILSVLNNFDFNSLVNPLLNRVDSGMDSPKVITVTTFSGNEYKILIGRKFAGKYCVKVESSDKTSDSFYSKWIYLIDSNRINALLLDKDDFIADYDSTAHNSTVNGKFSMPIE
jgi:hypothetical protein